MTIEETIEFFYGLQCHTPQAKDARDVALDTMHKYQKIEQILKEPCIIPEGCYPMLKKIKRVVEDGTNEKTSN